LQTAPEVCAETGTPDTYHKVEGPSTCLIILGIEVDTVAMELRLPPDKTVLLKKSDQGVEIEKGMHPP